MHQEFKSLLICPVCHAKLSEDESAYICENRDCSQRYPIVNGLPVLISESVSTFNLSAYTQQNKRNMGQSPSWRKRLRSFVPRISMNLAAQRNFKKLDRLLLEESSVPLALVLGGAEIGAGMYDFLQNERIKFLESDVAIGSRTETVFDASYIPLETESVDCIVVQAVLEYIPDPAQAVAEIFRVLKPRGIVYSEMPFMQDVHGGRYDFTRLTHLGHLRLFRHFAEIRSGACAGPGTALAWAIQHFFLAFVKASGQRDFIKIGTGLLFFWLKYIDYLLAGTPGGLDGASGTYLLARKSNQILSDRQLIASYRGAVPPTDVI